MKYPVYELEIDEDKELCSYNYYLGMKKNFYQHRIALMIKFDMMTIPKEAMIIPLGK